MKLTEEEQILEIIRNCSLNFTMKIKDIAGKNKIDKENSLVLAISAMMIANVLGLLGENEEEILDIAQKIGKNIADGAFQIRKERLKTTQH